jgi:hypothetical protein
MGFMEESWVAWGSLGSWKNFWLCQYGGDIGQDRMRAVPGSWIVHKPWPVLQGFVDWIFTFGAICLSHRAAALVIMVHAIVPRTAFRRDKP